MGGGGGGPSALSLNQYKDIWQKNKQKIMNCDNSKKRLVENLFYEQNPKLKAERDKVIAERKSRMLKKLQK